MTKEEDSFNCKLRNLFSKLDSNILIKHPEKQSTIFVYLKTDTENVTITQLRLLIVVQFLSKLYRNKVQINLKESTSETYLTSLRHILDYFDFDKSFAIKLINTNHEAIADDLKRSNYYESSPNNADQFRIDFTQIIHDYKLNFYDKNLKKTLVNNDDLNVYEIYKNFVETLSGESIVQVCQCSENYQRQKVDLLSRINQREYSVKYCCIGNVCSDESAAEYHIDSREKFFRNSAEQRNLISDELCESNIKNLTKFSLVFDFLITNHSNDIKKFKQMPQNISECLSEHSSFILYNCARIKAILDKYDNQVNQGVYSGSSHLNNINFYSLLNSDYEKKLCLSYLFKYEQLLDNVIAESSTSLQVNLKLVKLFKFIEELAHDFSKYYSKIHVLEDSKLVHLHEKMHARIYLFKFIYSLFESLLNLFNIDPIKRI